MENSITCVFGRKGSGKTWYIIKLIQNQKRLVIVDTLAEYGEKTNDLPFCKGVIIDDLYSFISYLQSTHDKEFRVILRLTDEAEVEKAFETIWTVGELLLVIEEVDYYCNPSFISPAFSKIYKYGRHKNLSTIAISRRPYEVNRLLTAQADTVVSFQQREQRDIEYLAKFSDGERAEKLRDLPVGQFIVWGDENILKKITQK